MIEINEKRLVETFMKLVQIDSETKHEARIATYLKELFLSLGLEVEEDQAKDQSAHEANNLICTLAGNVVGCDPIFFTAHMDTVTPGKQIEPQINQRVITSDGTTILGADDKAGIAVIIEVIRSLKETTASHGLIQFIITVGEESGLAGAKVLDRSLMKAKYGYALDSDGPIGHVVTAAPYQYKITAQVFGKSAHAGVAPEKGVSAISLAAKSIAKMTLGRIDEETTANIGYFKGGKASQTNVVCDYVEIVAEARSLNKDKVTAVCKGMERAFMQTTKQYGGKASINTTEVYPGFALSETADLLSYVKKATDTLQLPYQTMQSGGGSDANIFNGYGFPTANLAVGYEHIHTTKESIHIDNLVKLTALVLEIIAEVSR